jgi:hypothetical protein
VAHSTQGIGFAFADDHRDPGTGGIAYIFVGTIISAGPDHRTGSKTGGQLPGLEFPDSCCKSGFRFEENPAGLSNQKHQQLIKIKRNANAGIILF